MNCRRLRQTRLTFNTLYDSRPQWAADGRKLVFTRITADGNWEILRMNADGSDQVDLTNNPASSGASRRSTTGRLHARGSGVGTRLRHEHRRTRRAQDHEHSVVRLVSGPVATGRLVLFARDTARRQRRRPLGGARADGRGERQLTHQSSTGYISEATWSPDGSRIMYSQCAPRRRESVRAPRDERRRERRPRHLDAGDVADATFDDGVRRAPGNTLGPGRLDANERTARRHGGRQSPRQHDQVDTTSASAAVARRRLRHTSVDYPAARMATAAGVYARLRTLVGLDADGGYTGTPDAVRDPSGQPHLRAH